MRLIECDRCKRQITEGAEEFWSEIKVEGDVYDLCPDCMVLFDAFMSGGVQKEEPKQEAEQKRAPKQPQVDVGKIRSLAKAGWTTKQIAEDVKCSLPTVRKYMEETND